MEKSLKRNNEVIQALMGIFYAADEVSRDLES